MVERSTPALPVPIPLSVDFPVEQEQLDARAATHGAAVRRGCCGFRMRPDRPRCLPPARRDGHRGACLRSCISSESRFSPGAAATCCPSRWGRSPLWPPSRWSVGGEPSSWHGRRPSRSTANRHLWSSALFNGAMLALAAGAAGGVYTLLNGDSGEDLRPQASPVCCGPMLAADVVHCAVNGALVAIIVGLHQRVSPLVVFHGTMERSVVAYLGYGLFGMLLAVMWLPADVGSASGAAPAAAAVRGPLGLRAVRRRAAGLRPHGAHSDGGGRDERRLHPRPQRAGVDRVGAGGPRDRHARGSGGLAALRRHAARRRQAGRPDQGAAEVRWPHRGRVRRDPAAPDARPRDRPGDRLPGRGERRDHAPPRAASTVSATRWAWPGTGSRSSPG